MQPQRLPIVNSDDGVWGDIIRQYLMKEHFNDDTNNAANGGHQKITVRAGTTSAGTAPIKLTSGSLMTSPEAGAIEFLSDKLYFTQTTGTTRKTVATYDDASGATGDIYYRDSGGAFVRLGIGGSGNVLTVSSGIPSWQTPSGGTTFSDTVYTLQDNTDNTKQAKFDVPSGQTTATTRTHTLPAVDSTLASLAGTETLSNKTLTAPRIANTGFIADANGNEQLIFNTTASAVNEFTITNGATGTHPSITATGGDGNLNINLVPKGTGRLTVGGTNVPTISTTDTLTNKTLSTGTVLSVLPTGSGVASAATVSTLAARDANGNLFADAFIPSSASTATAAGTTTLTIDSAEVQFFTGSSTQTVTLPTTSIPVGYRITITNLSSGAVTVNSSGANLVASLSGGANHSVVIIANTATPTTAAHWTLHFTSALMPAASATNSTMAARNGQANLLADAFIPSSTSTATAAGTTTLTVDSTEVQIFTGTSTQTVTLPTTSIVAGQRYTVVNKSTGAVTVQSSGANSISVLTAGTEATFTAVVATPTTAANWSSDYVTGGGTVTATGGSLTSNAVVLGAGTTDTKVVTGVTTDGTSKLQLGVAGSSVGSIDFRNATSGAVNLAPTTGALGTSNLVLPAASDTLVGKATTDVLTNKTLTAPRITSGSNIADSNGNELIAFPSAVASAINEITVSNAAAGAAPSIVATGGDTNINLLQNGKGTGKVGLRDGSDTTKVALFDVSGVTTATTRTLGVPNASGTLALTSDVTASGIVVNVLDYGAVGNNSTNNDTAIAAAIAAVGTKGIVYFPAGTYRHTGITAVAGVTFKGAGRGRTILRNTHASNPTVSMHGTPGGPYLPGAAIESLTIDATAVNSGQPGISVQLAMAIRVTDVQVTGQGVGIKHHASWENIYQDVHVDNCTTGWYIPVPGAYTSSAPVTMIACHATACTTGLKVDDGMQSMSWVGGDFSGCTNGVDLDGNGTGQITFEGVNFEAITGDDVHVGSSSYGPAAVTFIGCRFFWSSTTKSRSVYFQRGDQLVFNTCRWTNSVLVARQDSTTGSLVMVGCSSIGQTHFIDLNGTYGDNISPLMVSTSGGGVSGFAPGADGKIGTLSASQWLGTKVLYGVGKTTVSDGDFTTTPVEGAIAGVYNTTDDTFRLAIRHYGSWVTMQAYSANLDTWSTKTAPSGTVVGTTDTQTLTNKTLTAPRMSSGTNIADSNGNELIAFPAAVASAVNEVTITNAATGASPSFYATGGDTNINLLLSGKGTGKVGFRDGADATKVAILDISGVTTATTRTLTVPNASTTLVGTDTIQTLTNKTLTAPRITSASNIADTNGNELIAFPSTVASAINEITVSNAAAGNKPTIAATGGDTNITLNLTSKGTGTVQANGVDISTASSTQTLTNKTIVFPGVASPTYTQGKLVYDTDNEALTFYNNNSNVSLQVGQEEWIRVTNNTGSTIANGAAVYLSGASGGYPTIALAKADAAATTIGAGLTTESIANGATGMVTTIGVVRGLDTSSFTAGQTVYISAATAGALTATAPTAPNYRYRVGIVGVSNATTGTIHVTPSTAALGNGTANQLFGINNGGTAQEVKSIVGTAGNVSVAHSANTITLDVGANIPTATSTTTFTNKTLTDPKINSIKDTNGNNSLTLLATASAVNYITVANASAGNSVALNATGSDSNVHLYLNPKGSAAIGQYVETGVTPTFFADGVDANLNLNLASKGTGKVTANGTEVATISGTQTLTNKRFTPRVVAVTSSATPAINSDNGDHFNLTSLATNVSSMTTNLTGTPTDGQKMMLRIKDDGTARTITWGTGFQSSGVATLLASTAVSKTHHLGFVYDSAISKWVCLAVDEFGY